MLAHSAIKRILVPLDVSAYAEACIRRACLLARANQARVTGMVVLDRPDIVRDSLPADPDLLFYDAFERVHELTEDAERRIREVLMRFARHCESEGVLHEEAEFQGVPSERIIQYSGYYDLVIMGLRTYFHFETQSGPGDSLERVLGHTPTPVLALPAGDRAIICSVLIAFDGSLASHRAVQAFARLLWPERVSVTVVMSHPEEAYRERALEMVEAYLRSHALSEIRTVGTEAEIRGVLEADYLERSDLVVAGMHAKHWIKDFFVGSLTRKLIDHGETALLLA